MRVTCYSLFSSKKEEEKKQDNQLFFAPPKNNVKQEESKSLFMTPPSKSNVEENKSLFNHVQNEFDEKDEKDSVSSGNSNCYLFGDNSSSHAESVVNLNLSLARSNETNTDTIHNGIILHIYHHLLEASNQWKLWSMLQDQEANTMKQDADTFGEVISLFHYHPQEGNIHHAVYVGKFYIN